MNSYNTVFLVDDTIIKPNSVWFHFQQIPRPGGHKFVIEVLLSNYKVINLLEKMTDCKIDDKKILDKLCTTTSSAFNVVNWILSTIENEPTKIEWVFNCIDRVEIDKEKLYVYGRCSQAMSNFV